ncbi:unnamed protein product [Caenorhabditis angaria]|nr:unnamed protein product [Caenorhabditis angaria]
MPHTILLIQPTTQSNSRTWSDYETQAASLDAICKIFETFARNKLPENAEFTFDINQVFEFLDKLTDISMMIFNAETAQYVPRNRSWIKQQLFEMFKSKCRHPEAGEKLIAGY